jgi:hypothetical protein
MEQAEGYVKEPEKSTSPLSTMKEVFEYGAQNGSISGKKRKGTVKVPSLGRSSEAD